MTKREASKAVLFLGPSDSPLLHFLRDVEDHVVTTSERITPQFLDENKIELIVSYGYRHLIKKDVLDKLPSRVVNLHVSLLPWNRGADPNFWSLVEGTPKGVTIHYVDVGLDTGDIIVQKEVAFSEGETLKTSYHKLQAEIQHLFKQNWEEIRFGKCRRIKQQGEGTFHYAKDKEGLLKLLADGWDTPVSILEELGARQGLQYKAE